MKSSLHARGGRITQLAAAALAGGLISAGGYALAASSGSTIHACSDAGTGTLHLQKRCHRGQRGISWNQRGPQGVRGPQGATGPAGASPVTAWAVVSGSGVTTGGHGITVQHLSAGTYRVTATPAQCSQTLISPPVVSVSDSNPPAGQAAGTFPVAWVADAGGGSFTVTTGIVAGGSFTPADITFNVQVPCS